MTDNPDLRCARGWLARASDVLTDAEQWWLSQYKHDVVVWRQQVSRTEAERDEAVALCASLQSALLSRLADLTEAAGKERSTEWLRTCASLPPEEWPPAPAYKGPMVPAERAKADRERLMGLISEKYQPERDALQARLSTIGETLGRAAGMMASDSRDWGRDRSDVWLYGLIVGWECEEQHEHDEVMCGGDGALREAALQHAWSVDDVIRIRRFRAALQGDQPTEPRRPLIPPDDPCQDFRCSRIDGRCVGMHCARCGEPCGAQGHTCSTDAAEPTGEADRG